MWHQTEIRLRPRPRGFHLITDEIVAALPALSDCEVGLLHLFLQHTSAALTINENADPTVRGDFARWFDQAVPDGAPYFRHVDEGPEDMPAHVKGSLLGCELHVPIGHGRLRLGTWQGLYLCEHRDQAGARRIVATIQGRPSERGGLRARGG
jgi:secondary thiamine-phosphate synthase enzyme